MKSDVVWSKNSDEWETPRWLYDKLDSIFHFTLDPCATHENHKCTKYYTIEQDGLLQDWNNEIAFINPPYSKIKDWAKKWAQAYRGTFVLLIPSRTDTRYVHQYIFPHSSVVCFVKGRLKFGGINVNEKNSAPFPSMLAIYGIVDDKQLDVLQEIGFLMKRIF
jgi:phage N-6-adenine-methyltransferase